MYSYSYCCFVGPLALIVGRFVPQPESLVVEVPLLIFILMLPGLLYEDLIFDVQRSMSVELFICLLPPSGIAMILRKIFYSESMNIKASLSMTMPVSHTPLQYFYAVLGIDVLLYVWLSLLLSQGDVSSVVRKGFQMFISSLGRLCYRSKQLLCCRVFRSRQYPQYEPIDSAPDDLEMSHYATPPTAFAGDLFQCQHQQRFATSRDDDYEQANCLMRIANICKSFPIANLFYVKYGAKAYFLPI